MNQSTRRMVQTSPRIVTSQYCLSYPLQMLRFTVDTVRGFREEIYETCVSILIKCLATVQGRLVHLGVYLIPDAGLKHLGAKKILK